MPERQFPPPWSVEEKSAHFAICDSNGQALAFVYFEKESSRRSAPNLLSKDEARRIATQMARVPELLQMDQPEQAGRVGRQKSNWRLGVA
jgi:hypothetical protein